MKISLQTRVSVFTTLIILFISAVGTYLFAANYSKSKEQEFSVRGSALSYALAKAAEEGLLKEDLNLIKKASYIIKAPDVALAQVYSSIWEAVDAFPVERLHTQPHPDALRHFKASTAPFHAAVPGGHDFYEPVFFRASEHSSPTAIGFVRVMLSSSAFEHELRGIAARTIAVSLVMTLFAILALNLLIRRLVVRPVMALHESISRFKNGEPAKDAAAFRRGTHELRELAFEFNRMCGTVREKEAKLIESDRRIRSLFERVEHAIFRTDANGVIAEANDRFRRMFGGADGLCDILAGELESSNCLRRAVAERSLHIEDKAIGRKGEDLVISLSLYAELNEGGEIEGFDGYIIDITEKKRLEERLMRSQKLEAVGTLAAGMAHDFNNLLTAILGYSGIMLKKVPDDDPLHHPVAVINEAAKRGAELGRKILAVTRKDKMEAKPVDLNGIVRNSLELLRTSIPGSIELVTRLDDALPLTVADPSQLHQVIMNLAVNGRDAMPHGGRLTLETSSAASANGTGGMYPEGPGFVKLTVSDTGQGIDTGTQAKIFDPFFTTKEVGKGTGLGLYIVHSIVSNHGGYVNVYSEPGRGTRFNIYLPAAKSAVLETPVELVDIRGTETLLVIDDESNVRELCRDMLAPLGYTVLLAGSGGDGLALFREKRGDISLVILDMIMPKMGGNEVFHSLRTIDAAVRVLLYSGYSHNNFAGISELLNHGAAGFVQKPFTSQDLGSAIRKALE
jgi:PAS domain S-box-containing protein